MNATEMEQVTTVDIVIDKALGFMNTKIDQYNDWAKDETHTQKVYRNIVSGLAITAVGAEVIAQNISKRSLPAALGKTGLHLVAGSCLLGVACFAELEPQDLSLVANRAMLDSDGQWYIPGHTPEEVT